MCALLPPGHAQVQNSDHLRHASPVMGNVGSRIVAIGTLVAVFGGAACAKNDGPEEPVDPGVRGDAAAVDGPRDAVRREVMPPSPPTGPIPPWTAADIGMVGMPRGEVRASTNLVSVRAAGMDIGGTVDSFHFVSQKAHGDFEVLTRVRSLQMVNPDSKAGIMVRASDTDPAAANVFLTVLADPMRGGQLQVRATSGAETSVFGPDTGVRAGQWLRLTRRGRTFTASRSASRLDWIKVGSADLDLPAEVTVGLAVAAKNARTATTAEFDGLRVADLASQPATRDWILDEIATMGASAIWNGGALTVSGHGEPLSLLMESGVLAYTSLGGNQVLTARVASFTHSDPGARIGLMIRQGPPVAFSRTQPAVILNLTAGMGVQFQSRASNNLMATAAPVSSGIKAPVWLRLERIEEPGPPISSRFVGSFSADGSQWTVAGEASFALPEPFLIGVTVGSNGSGTPATATFTNLTLTTSGAPAAPPPPSPDAGVADRGGG